MRPETGAHRGGAGALAVLELLAQEAPPALFEALLHEARRTGAGAAEVAELTRALELAETVRGNAGLGRQRKASLAALVDTAHDLTSPYHLDGLLRVINRRARRLLGLDMAWVSLNRPDGTGYVRTSEGESTTQNIGLELGAGLGSAAQTHRTPLWSADYPNDDTVPHGPGIDTVARAEGLRAIIAVPLRNGDSTLGVLYGSNREVRRFTPDEIGLLLSLADLAAVAIEKARLLEQTRRRSPSWSGSDPTPTPR